MSDDKVDPPLRAERCETCRFWDRKPDDEQREWPPLGADEGRCRRLPPQLSFVPHMAAAMEAVDDRKSLDDVAEHTHCGGSGYWPETLNFDWCGEWRSIRRNK